MQEAYEHLRKMLVTGELKPGTRLVNRALSERFQMSTVTLREAIHRLTSEGLVEHVPNAGAFVRRLDRRDVQKLYRYRDALECFALEELIPIVDEFQLASLREICDRWRAMCHRIRTMPGAQADAETVRAWLVLDLRFHTELYAAADNPWLTKSVQDLDLMSRIVQTKPQELSLAIAANTWRSHRALVRAIERKDDVDAKRWMLYHNRQALKLVLGTPGDTP